MRRSLGAAGREGEVAQFLVNPDEEALWNLQSACTDTASLKLHLVAAPCDDVPVPMSTLGEGGEEGPFPAIPDVLLPRGVAFMLSGRVFLS